MFACLNVAIAAPDLDILLLICWPVCPITPMQLFSLSTKSLVVPEAGAPLTIPLPTPDIATGY